MEQKYVPLRQCIGCRQVNDKHSMIRIVRKSDGSFVPDEHGSMAGRGAYICRDEKCLAKALKSKSLNRAYKDNVSQRHYDVLFEEMGKLI